MISEASAQNSIAKSRSATASSEFSHRPSKPSSRATRARSIGKLEPALDVEVHVLGLERPLEAAAVDLAADARKAALDGRKIAPGKDAAGGKHSSMRKRAPDVLLCEALVEADRRGKALHLLVDRFLEAARPELRLLRHAWRMQLKTSS